MVVINFKIEYYFSFLKKKNMSRRTRNYNHSCWLKKNIYYRKHGMPTAVSLGINLSKTFTWRENDFKPSSSLHCIRYFSNNNIMISHPDFLITADAYIKFKNE